MVIFSFFIQIFCFDFQTSCVLLVFNNMLAFGINPFFYPLKMIVDFVRIFSHLTHKFLFVIIDVSSHLVYHFKLHFHLGITTFQVISQLVQLEIEVFNFCFCSTKFTFSLNEFFSPCSIDLHASFFNRLENSWLSMRFKQSKFYFTQTTLMSVN